MFEYIPAPFAANLLTVLIVFCYERWGGWLRNCIGKILQTGIFFFQENLNKIMKRFKS